MKINDNCFFGNILKSRNRIVMAPMGTMMAEDGIINDFHIQHYGSRAYGGVGIVILESTAVSPEGVITDKDIGLWCDEQIHGLQRIVSIVKQAGSLIGIQLNHAGSKSQTNKMMRCGATNFFNEFNHNTKENHRIATPEDINRIINDFVSAAKRAKIAGFDFIEIHAAHGFFLSELISNLTNDIVKSNDMSVRAAVVIEVVRRIYQEVKNMPLVIRFSISDYDPAGISPKSFEPLVKQLDPYIDVYDLSSGATVNNKGYNNLGDKLYKLAISEEFRFLTNKPLIVNGNFCDRSDVQRALDKGMEFIAIGRGLINNPAIVINHLLEAKEIDDKIYHWNNNQWFHYGDYNRWLETQEKENNKNK